MGAKHTSLTAVASLFLAGSALAQDASTLYRESEKAYKAGDFRAAIDLMSRACAIAPDPLCLFNIARAYDKLGDLPTAAAHYRRFLELNPEGEPRARAEARLGDIRPLLPGKIKVVSPVDGLEVSIDDKGVGVTPMEAIGAAPGSHVLVVKHPDFVQGRYNVVVAAEKVSEVQVSPARARGMVSVKANVQSGRLLVDGEDRGVVAFPFSIEMPVGVHEVVVEAPGHTRDRTAVNVKGGEMAKVNLVLSPLVPAPATRPAEVPFQVKAAGVPAPRPTWPWYIIAGGFAVVGGGATLTILAEQDRGKVGSPNLDKQGRITTSMREAKELEAAGNRKANAALGLYITGGAAIATGTALLLFLPSSATRAGPPPLSLSPLQRGIGLSGTF